MSARVVNSACKLEHDAITASACIQVHMLSCVGKNLAGISEQIPLHLELDGMTLRLQFLVASDKLGEITALVGRL